MIDEDEIRRILFGPNDRGIALSAALVREIMRYNAMCAMREIGTTDEDDYDDEWYWDEE